MVDIYLKIIKQLSYYSRILNLKLKFFKSI